MRLIAGLHPRYNRQATDPDRYRYVRVATTADGGLRATVTRVVDPDAAIHLGPVASVSAARRVVEALAVVLPDIVAPSRRSTTLASLPTIADATDSAHTAMTPDDVRAALGGAPALLLDRLGMAMGVLAAGERFEQAAQVRDRAAALAAALADQGRLGWLHRSGRVVAEVPGVGGVELDGGIVVAAWGPDGQVRPVDTPLAAQAEAERHAGVLTDRTPGTHRGPVPRWLVDELRVVSRWLDRHAAALRLEVNGPGPTSPWPRPPRFRATAPANGPALAA